MKEFETQICTTIEQSKRLLDLGLKPETADCRHLAYTTDSKGKPIPKRNQKWSTRIGIDESVPVCGFMKASFVPAWSLHRLIEMCPETIFSKEHCSFFRLTLYKCSVLYVNDVDFVLHAPTYQETIYDAIIEAIQWLIENNYLSNN